MAKPSKRRYARQEGGHEGREAREEGPRQEAGCPRGRGRTWRVSTCPFRTPSTSG